MRVPSIATFLLSSALAGPAVLAADFVAVCSGDQEVPAVDTKARATAIFRVSGDGTAVDYQLIGANLDNAVFSHIHVAEAGVNGPVVVFLFGPVPAGSGKSNGLLARGTFTAADLVGPLAGQPLSALIDAMAAGGAYVNIHTDDGIDPINTGAGDTRTGEVRGQIRPAAAGEVD
jgi:hypothetical protein